MRERIRATVAAVFDLSPAEVPDDASPETLADWVSLRHLELVLELEMSFGVRVPAEVVPELLSLDAIEDALCELNAT